MVTAAARKGPDLPGYRCGKDKNVAHTDKFVKILQNSMRQIGFFVHQMAL